MAKWPKMISTKDLSYISDMFNWNNTMIKKLEDYNDYCDDEQLCKIINDASILFNNNASNLIEILESGESYGK